MYILTGDIGGTKTLLAIAKHSAGASQIIFRERLESQQYPRFEDLLAAFLAHANMADTAFAAACLGVAGPVQGMPPRQVTQVTNLPWRLASADLSAGLGGIPVELVNDFAAIAHSLDHLCADDLVQLQTGAADPGGLRLVAGAGTGLGVCAITAAGCVIPTEGGHAGFAPGDERQLRLWQFIAAQDGRCTREHLLSGSGIGRIAEFVAVDSGRPISDSLAQAMNQGDPAAAVTAAAQHGTDPVASEALDLFTTIYAGQVGDLALTFLATGGVYIAGGIAPRILDRLQTPSFRTAFNRKPPMNHLTARIPLQVITNTEAGLLGALQHAVALASATSTHDD